MIGDKVTIRWYAESVLRDSVLAGRLLREQDPRDGDFIVVRVPKARARAVEEALRTALFTQGVEVGQ